VRLDHCVFLPSEWSRCQYLYAYAVFMSLSKVCETRAGVIMQNDADFVDVSLPYIAATVKMKLKKSGGTATDLFRTFTVFVLYLCQS
jgi:hypothetical protein